MQSFIVVSYSSKSLFNNNLIVSIKKSTFLLPSRFNLLAHSASSVGPKEVDN